jgi:regulatory protein
MRYRIKKVCPQKKSTSRVNVYFSSFTIGISAKISFENKLSSGVNLSSSDLKKIIAADFLEKAVDKGLRLIGNRPHSEAEISQKLRVYLGKTIKMTSQKTKLDFSEILPSVGADALAVLKGKNFINDEVFTNWWIEQRAEFRPRSKRQLYFELVQKGIERNLIERKLSGVDYDEKSAAVLLIEKKLKIMPKSMSDTEKKNKLIAYLSRKGFSFSQIIDLIDERLGRR